MRLVVLLSLVWWLALGGGLWSAWFGFGCVVGAGGAGFGFGCAVGVLRGVTVLGLVWGRGYWGVMPVLWWVWW